MIVLKFGGTSVGSVENIRKTLEIISQYKKAEKQFAVVVSAMSGVTNQLIAMSRLAEVGNEDYLQHFKNLEEKHFNVVKELLTAQEQSNVFLKIKQLLNALEDILHGVFLLNELSTRALDFILSHGERLNASIIAAAGKEIGLPTEFCDAVKIIRTDSKYGSARVDFESTNHLIQQYFNAHSDIQIVTGFVASNANGLTTTLGRGGSDYTASIIAAALDADSVEIWTDVDGVMTTDPRKVKDAFSLKALSYQEAMELSHFGAKVIYPPTLQPVFSKKIPIWIKNTFNPGFMGTLISEDSLDVTDSPVKGISSINDVAIINLQGSGMVGVTGTSSRLFESLGNEGVNIILITQASSEHSICIAVAPEDALKAKTALESIFHYEIADGKIDPVIIERGLSIIALIGDNMANVPGVAGTMFSALGQNGINIRAIAQGSSERNISVVIDQGESTKALNALHDAFFLSDTHTLNLFIVGHGLVGRQLLEQIAVQYDYLLKERHIRINLVGITNSRKMAFQAEGIPISSWEETLDNSSQEANLELFIDQMIGYNMPNSIFVDNTSNREIVNHYEKVLAESIHIVTPNKTATSESYSTYLKIKNLANKKKVKFLFETNVGAGLPVISTLQDLRQSGDEIKKIEGVFSGTLSYIFNHYDGSKPLAMVVKEAQDLGYTEPDPREDLSGQDVARKILILAREAGYQLEPEDVHIDPILPKSCLDATSVNDFYDRLLDEEERFRAMLNKAHEEGKKLRVVAALKDGSAMLGLRSFGTDHPFFGLSGSDNMIAYTSHRYATQPLVVRGPGAGAAVTAAGVFSDIIRTSNR